MSEKVPDIYLERARGDTRRIPFRVMDKNRKPVDISTWTDFVLTVDPDKAPLTADNNVAAMVGQVLDGPEGRVAFFPDGTVPAGTYFYDCQATDDNAEKGTLAKGRYVVVQDIGKS